MDTKITIADLLSAKRQNRKIVAVSCYDYITAQLVSQTDVQMILVGDSAAQVVLGFESTLPATAKHNDCLFYDVDVFLSAHILEYLRPNGGTDLSNVGFFEQ